MNIAACNYNSAANTDDGSCVLSGDPCDDGNASTVNDVIDANCGCSGTLLIIGCTDATACNYDAVANTDDGSCIHPGDACDDGNPQTINDIYDANCVCSGTLVGVEEWNATNGISIFPNPTQNSLNIRWESAVSEMFSVTVYSVSGQKVEQQQWMVVMGTNQHVINTAEWEAGFYFIELNAHNETVRAHVIKE
jgi:hypothetical protein